MITKLVTDVSKCFAGVTCQKHGDINGNDSLGEDGLRALINCLTHMVVTVTLRLINGDIEIVGLAKFPVTGAGMEFESIDSGTLNLRG